MDVSSAAECGEEKGVPALENRVEMADEEAVMAASDSCGQYAAALCAEDCGVGKRKYECGDSDDKADKGRTPSAGKGLCNGKAGDRPVMPQHSRPVRFNRGIKRRFPGDEYDDSVLRRRARVRSMSEVCVLSAQCGGSSMQQCQGEVPISQAKRKGRPFKSVASRKRQQSKKLQLETTKNVVKRGQAGNTAESFKHLKSETFRCNEKGCDKVFADSSALYRHARVHGDRPFVCHYDGCNKRFLERSKLKRHFLIHTGEKSFVCRYEGCGKAFSLDFNLRSHMKTHTGEYHECPHEGCEKKYCQNYKLRAHINKEHKEGVCMKSKFVLSSGKSSSAPVAQNPAKKQEKVKLLDSRKDKIEKWKDGRRNMIKELQPERPEGAKRLVKIEKALEGMSDLTQRLKIYDSELLSAVDTDFGQFLGEEKEVLVFAQKLPPGDQGARLVHAVKLQLSYQPQNTIAPTSPQLQAVEVTMENGLAGVKDGGVLLGTKLDMPAVDHTDSWIQKHTGDKQKQRMALNSCFAKSKSCTSPMASKFVSCSDQDQDCEARLHTKIQPSTSDLDLDRINQHQKFLLQQQSEPPVVHLFSFQEQPCLVD